MTLSIQGRFRLASIRFFKAIRPIPFVKITKLVDGHRAVKSLQRISLNPASHFFKDVKRQNDKFD